MDLNDLTAQMEWFIQNREKVATLKKNARRYAEENLNWKRNSVVIDEIFKNIKLNESNNSLLIEVKNFIESRPFKNISKMLLPYWWLKGKLEKNG